MTQEAYTHAVTKNLMKFHLNYNIYQNNVGKMEEQTLAIWIQLISEHLKPSVSICTVYFILRVSILKKNRTDESYVINES